MQKQGLYDSDPESKFQIKRQENHANLLIWKKKEDAFLRRQERKENKNFSDLDEYIGFRIHQIINTKNSKYKSYDDSDVLYEQIKADVEADIKKHELKQNHEDDLITDDDVHEFLENQNKKYNKKFKNMNEYFKFISKKIKNKTKKNGNGSEHSSSSESIHGGRRKTYNKRNRTNKRNIK